MSAAFFASSMDASAAAEFATATAKEATSSGLASVDLAPVIKALTDKKLAAGACLAFKEFASCPSLMSFVVQNLPKLIEALNDKQKPVVAAAKEALTAITDKMPVWAIGQVLPCSLAG